MRFFRSGRRGWIVSLVLVVAVIGGGASGLLGVCGPFTDFTDAGFCPFVLEIFYLGITTGTTPTTYSPADNVTRLQMAAFLSRTVDRTLIRGSRRAALGQFYSTQAPGNIGVTVVGTAPFNVRCDGSDLWVTNNVSGTVSRVRGSDGKLLETWTGAVGAYNVVVGFSRVLVTGNQAPGRLYSIDPSQPAGAVATVASNLGDDPRGITYDGRRIWTANRASSSVSIVTPGTSVPWSVSTVTTGFSGPFAALHDGTSVWVTDFNAGTLLRLGELGDVLQTVTVGTNPVNPVFDGTSIWVPNSGSNSVSVVRATSGAVLATLTSNGLNSPETAAFDGQRVLVTNANGDSVSLWKAADLTALGSSTTGVSTAPSGACSDGVNFWLTLETASQLLRF